MNGFKENNLIRDVQDFTARNIIKMIEKEMRKTGTRGGYGSMELITGMSIIKSAIEKEYNTESVKKKDELSKYKAEIEVEGSAIVELEANSWEEASERVDEMLDKREIDLGLDYFVDVRLVDE